MFVAGVVARVIRVTAGLASAQGEHGADGDGGEE